MKILISISMAALFLFAHAGEAEQRDIPIGERLDKLTKSIMIPRIDYDHTPGVVILEFIRSKVWSTNPLDGGAPRPTHEYRCNPDRLLTEITFQRQNVSYGDALTAVCRELGITWKIERETIVIFDGSSAHPNKGDQPAPSEGITPSRSDG